MNAPEPLTARELAPPELIELLGLMVELAEFLPSARTSDGWERRTQVSLSRQALLSSRLEMLVDELKNGGKYPLSAEEMLTAYCQRSADVIRAELARPLGYEPLRYESRAG